MMTQKTRKEEREKESEQERETSFGSYTFFPPPEPALCKLG